MRTIIVALLVTVVMSSAAFSQNTAKNIALYDGVWVRSDLIDALKKTRSVPASLRSVQAPSLPLAFVIDVRSDSIRSCMIAPSFHDSAHVPLPYQRVPSFGNRFIYNGQWVFAVDSMNGQYIAVYERTNAVEKPIVYARIPSKNRSTAFVLQRIVNASVLDGRWVDSAGGEYRFFSDQHAEWPAGTFAYTLTIEAGGRHRLQIVGGKLYSWESDGNTLILYVPSDKGRKGRRTIRLQRN